jgi:hypothetical protein
MVTQEPTIEQILGSVKQLTLAQKLRLIEAIVPDLEELLQQAERERSRCAPYMACGRNLALTSALKRSMQPNERGGRTFLRENK